MACSRNSLQTLPYYSCAQHATLGVRLMLSMLTTLNTAPVNLYKSQELNSGLGILRSCVLSHSLLNGAFHSLHDDWYINQSFCILLYPFLWVARRWALAVYARCWPLKEAHKQHITLATAQQCYCPSSHMLKVHDKQDQPRWLCN